MHRITLTMYLLEYNRADCVAYTNRLRCRDTERGAFSLSSSPQCCVTCEWRPQSQLKFEIWCLIQRRCKPTVLYTSAIYAELNSLRRCDLSIITFSSHDLYISACTDLQALFCSDTFHPSRSASPSLIASLTPSNMPIATETTTPKKSFQIGPDVEVLAWSQAH